MLRTLTKIRMKLLGRLYRDVIELKAANKELRLKTDALQRELRNANYFIDDLTGKIDGLAQQHTELAREYRKTATERALGIRSATDL